MTPDTRFAAVDWLDLDWYEWTPFRPLSESGLPGTGELPNESGLYRIRHPVFDCLVYIGETGRSVRGRVGALARGTFADTMPFRDPHTAAPTLWAIREEYGRGFECSWVTPELAADKQTRKGLEAALIACHRLGADKSPVANFGRIIDGYVQSSYSHVGDTGRGGPLPSDATEPNNATGSPPPDWDDPTEVTDDAWLGLDWMTPGDLPSSGEIAPAEGGVYRLWDSGADRLTYIGESADLRSRLKSHARDRDASLQASYAVLPHRASAHERLEVETDLLGAHWLATGTAPVDQF